MYDAMPMPEFEMELALSEDSRVALRAINGRLRSWEKLEADFYDRYSADSCCSFRLVEGVLEAWTLEQLEEECDFLRACSSRPD